MILILAKDPCCQSYKRYTIRGSGCGAVGREVTSDTRGPRFESSHRQLLLNIYLLLTVCRKDENKEKEAGNGPFFKKMLYDLKLRCYIMLTRIFKPIRFLNHTEFIGHSSSNYGKLTLFDWSPFDYFGINVQMIKVLMLRRIQYSQTGDQLYRDTSPLR